MCHEAIDRLADLNRADQFTVLEHATEVLAASPAVTHLMVRGSFAKGTSDRLSDVDLVVGVTDEQFTTFATVHDALISTELNGLLPAWPDKIVPRMGGLGYVHLIDAGGRLHQLDLYLAPTSRIRDLTLLTRGEVIYEAPGIRDTTRAPRRDVEAFIADQLAAPLTCGQLVVEALVLAWMIRKRIKRSQQFMAYTEMHLLTTAARTLMRTALSPQRAYYGWYHLEDDLGITPIGQDCLKELEALIALPPVPTVGSLDDCLRRILAVARRAAPDAVQTLQLPIDAYMYHLARS
ncbi:hypothetical protein ABZ815_20125 [Nonomuraea sp. NPDC047529]|uniref:hypothetical protein n=1 Tax=Nonomuraea sp. NPDC047529 TaxID=3155623 RepID=UPI0033D40EA3